MRSSYLLSTLPIWFLFVACSIFGTPPTIPTIETSPEANQKIDINNFDSEFLKDLLVQHINVLRKRKKLTLLKNDPLLEKAAIDQNEYVKRKGALTHNQTKAEKHSVGDRVEYYEGNYSVVGENIQYNGFSILTRGSKKTVIYPTYAEAAKEMAQNWVDSKNHYKNLIHKEFSRAGTAIVYDAKRKGIYATQVYGSEPF